MDAEALMLMYRAVPFMRSGRRRGAGRGRTVGETWEARERRPVREDWEAWERRPARETWEARERRPVREGREGRGSIPTMRLASIISGLQMLKPGGRLVYSTCTFAPEEDEGSVADLLETHPGTKVEHRVVKGFADLGRGRPEWVEEGPGREGLEYTYRVWPHQVKGEGHYLAALKKAGESSASVGRPGWPGPGAGPLEDRRPPRAQAERAGGKGASAGKKAERQEIWQLFTAFCQETLSTRPWELQPGRYLTFGGQLYYVPSAMPDMDGLKVLRPGLHLGTFKKNRFEPAHALALYLRPEHVKRQADLPCLSQEAERYLRGEALMVGGAEDGWTLVTVDGYSLGWGKAAKGVLKNHYPKGLRLQGGL